MTEWRQDELLNTRRFYSGVGLWPAMPKDMDPEGWLKNFRGDLDTRLALALLDSMVHLTTSQTKRLVESAFHSLSLRVEHLRDKSPYRGIAWTQFRRSVLVSYPQEDVFDPAASGRMFVRQARASLVDYESQLKDPPELIADLYASSKPVDVVLVDDFAGTGDQFVDSMDVRYQVRDFEDVSLRMLFDEGKVGLLAYVPAVATHVACSKIEDQFPGIIVSPAHKLPPEYGADHPKTMLVPSDLRQELIPFLHRYAQRAGYTPGQALGHGGSGLALSFEHGVPDNSLPIFWSEADGWTTLRRRVQA